MSQRSQPRTPSPKLRITQGTPIPQSPLQQRFYANLFEHVQIRHHKRSSNIFAQPLASPSKSPKSPFQDILAILGEDPMDSATQTQTRTQTRTEPDFGSSRQPPRQPPNNSNAGPSNKGKDPAPPDDGGDDGDGDGEGGGGGGGDGGGGEPGDPGDGGGGGGDDPTDDEDADYAQRRELIRTLRSLNTTFEKLGPSGNEKTEVKKPEIFDGSDPKKLRPFLILVQLNLQNRPRAYSTDAAKIAFTLSYLGGTALEFFEPFILDPDQDDPPQWSQSFIAFVQELKDNFGVYDEAGDAEDRLETLQMKESDRASKYCVRFQQLASQTAWDEAALRYFFRKGLAARIKDALSLTREETTLVLFKAQVLRVDARYWRRQTEKKREQGHSGSSSGSGGKGNDGKGGGSGNSGGSGKSSGSGKPKSGNNSSSNSNSSTSSSSSSSSSSSGNPKPWADKLGKNGKLTQAEKDRRKKNNLCMFCGGGKHSIDNCDKRKASNEARGRAASTSTPAAGTSNSGPEK